MSENVETKQREAELEDQPVARGIEPVYIYLYYLKFAPHQAEPVETRAYFCSDSADTYDQAQIQRLIETFAANAHEDGPHPRSFGANLDALGRFKKGFLAIVVDAPGQQPGTGTLTFEGRFNGVWNDASHTLSPPRQIGVTVSDGGGGTRDIIAFYSYNGLNEPDYTDLDKGESEYIRFTLTFPGALTGFPYQDSGGTNMGPPVGPPYYL